MEPTVRAEIDSWENAQMQAVKEADKKALELYDKALETPRKQIARNDKMKKVVHPYAEVKSFLTEYSVNTAQEIFNRWVELETLLLVKYIDGNVKAQNPDGTFVTNPYTDHIPDRISQPGYTDKWKEAVDKDHGDIIEVK